MLAWYQEEKALRVIGRECGHKFYGDDFATKRQFRKERDGDTDFDFLVSNLPRVKDFLAAIENLAPIAVELDKIRHRVIKGISKKTAKSLHQHIVTNSGLALFEQRKIAIPDIVGNDIVDQTGKTQTRVSSTMVSLQPIEGHDMLIDRKSNTSELIYRADLNLRRLSFSTEDDIAEALVEWDLDGMRRACKDLLEGRKLLSDALRLCREIQLFLAEKNLEVLMKWSFDMRAPVHLDLRKNAFGNYEFKGPQHIGRVIPSTRELCALFPSLPPIE